MEELWDYEEEHWSYEDRNYQRLYAENFDDENYTPSSTNNP